MPWYELAFEKKAKKKVRSYAPPAPLAPLADTHAHLTCFWSAEAAECLARAALAGVRQLTTLWDPLGDELDFPAYRERLAGWIAAARVLLAEAPAGAGLVAGVFGEPADLLSHVRFLAGVHPYGAPGYTDDVHAQVLAALADPLCVGVGEIGLDYHFDEDDDIAPAAHDVQMACFARQLEVAVERDLPVELHLRNDPADEARTAHADAYRVLREVGVPAAGCVLHCFGEDRATMERFVGLGCHIAYGGAATFGRNECVREALAATPPDRILFETDCPYMAPMPIRGLECEPAMIAFTADALARDRAERTGEDAAEVQRAAWENARALLGGVRG